VLGASVDLDLGEQVCGGKRFAQAVFHQGLALVVVRGDRDQELRIDSNRPCEPARCSVIRRQRGLPVRAAPMPARPSRTRST
jgi:hypothetical protein